MSGKHRALADLAEQCFPDGLHKDARRMRDCLLENQQHTRQPTFALRRSARTWACGAQASRPTLAFTGKPKNSSLHAHRHNNNMARSFAAASKTTVLIGSWACAGELGISKRTGNGDPFCTQPMCVGHSHRFVAL